MALILREMDRTGRKFWRRRIEQGTRVFSRGTDVKIRNDDLSRKARYEARNV